MGSCHGHCPCTHDWDCPYDRPTQVRTNTTAITGYSRPVQVPQKLSRKALKAKRKAEQQAMSRAFIPKPVKVQRAFAPVKGNVTRAIPRSGNR